MRKIALLAVAASSRPVAVGMVGYLVTAAALLGRSALAGALPFA